MGVMVGLERSMAGFSAELHLIWMRQGGSWRRWRDCSLDVALNAEELVEGGRCEELRYAPAERPVGVNVTDKRSLW